MKGNSLAALMGIAGGAQGLSRGLDQFAHVRSEEDAREAETTRANDALALRALLSGQFQLPGPRGNTLETPSAQGQSGMAHGPVVPSTSSVPELREQPSSPPPISSSIPGMPHAPGAALSRLLTGSPSPATAAGPSAPGASQTPGTWSGSALRGLVAPSSPAALRIGGQSLVPNPNYQTPQQATTARQSSQSTLNNRRAYIALKTAFPNDPLASLPFDDEVGWENLFNLKKEQGNRSTSTASPVVRTAQLPDGRRVVEQRTQAGSWEPARTAAGDTVFAPMPVVRAPKATSNAAQSQLDKQQGAFRSVLGRRPRQSQYADPLTRMPDSTAYDEAMTNWRSDSTAASGSLQRAQDALAALQSGAGRGGTSAKKALSARDSVKAKEDPAFAAWLRANGYAVPPD